jgi:hypothetical protein
MRLIGIALGALFVLVLAAAPAGAFSVGQTCNGNYTTGPGTQSPPVFCSGQGTPSQDVWVTISNTGSVPFAPEACTSPTSCQGIDAAGFAADNYPNYAVSPGDSGYVPIPSGQTLGLFTFSQNQNTPPPGPVAATITGIYPQSSPPALSAGQVCSGSNFVPVQVQCIWTNQVGAVTQNSWVTFANTGPQVVGMSFNGLHGSGDSQTLQPGQLAYVGVGAGHTTDLSQLSMVQTAQNGTAFSVANLPIPPSPPGQVTIQSVVPENYSGFNLASGQSCTTSNYVSNPVSCAPSAQIGQGSSSGSQSVTIANTGNSNSALVGNVNGGGGLLTLAPGASGTTSFDKNSQLLLTCITGSNNCSAGANASIKVTSVTSASNAATLSSPTRTRHGFRGRLRCGAPKHRRCQGTVTLRAKRGGPVADRATFDLGARGRGKVTLSSDSKLSHGVLTTKTRQPSGRQVVTDQRNV